MTEGHPEWVEIQEHIDKRDVAIAFMQKEEEREYTEADTEIARLIHGVRVERAACKHMDEQLATLAKDMQGNMMASLDKEKRDCGAVDLRLGRVAEECVAEVRGLLADENQSQRDSVKQTQEICDEICHLYTDLEQTQKFRTEKAERLHEVVRSKLDEIRDAVAAEQRIRMDSESTFLELFAKMGKKMQKELDESRKERHTATDRLFSMMETVLPNLEKARVKRSMAVRESLVDDVSDPRTMVAAATRALRAKNAEKLPLI